MKVLVAQLCPTLCNSMNCSLPGSSIHGILQARILEWVATPCSRGSSQPRDWTQVSWIAGRFFYCLRHREDQYTLYMYNIIYNNIFLLLIIQILILQDFGSTFPSDSPWIFWVIIKIFQEREESVMFHGLLIKPLKFHDWLLWKCVFIN